MDLRVISLFKHLSEAELARIRALCSISSIAKGKSIVGDRDKTTDVFFVLSGTVRVTSFTAEGREFIFNDVSAGGVFGEFSAIDRLPRSASGVALSDCTLARMPASAFVAMLQESNPVCLQLVELLVAKMRDMSARLFETSVLVLRERFRRELLRLATTIGKPDGEGIMISQAPTQVELAARIGSHREAVTRELSRLKRKKVLDYRRHWIRIVDLEWLKDDEDL
jgi:CRP-like cAMP-binding protein